jgi:TatD DNase family protein
MTHMFDSHCHLQMPVFAGDLPDVLERARQDGLEGSVVIGMDVPSSRQAINLAARHDALYATVGVHPHDASCVDAEGLDALHTMAREPRVVAIGETGLDFYRNLSAPAAQRRAFREQLALAQELDLPVVIHSRQAQQETFAILKEWASGQRRAKPLGVLHCYAGDADLAGQYALLGFMISFAGNVTYPNARRLQSVAAQAPLEQLLVETDCPFLPPQSRRGRRCEPAHLRETLEFIAGHRNSSFEDLAAATTANARRLYRLDSKERGA